MARFSLLPIISFLLLLVQVSAATTYYLSVLDHTGKQLLTNPSTVKNAPRQSVQITTFSLNTNSPIDAATGQSTGKFRSSVLTINRTADANSALLLEQAVVNANLKSVVLSATAPNQAGLTVTLLKYTLTNAKVVSFSHGPASPSGVIESLGFSFQKLDFLSGANAATFDFGGIAT